MDAKPPLVILVCGGRDYVNRQRVFEILDAALVRRTVAKIVHGGARGADTLAGEWARSRGIPEARYLANWDRDKNAAGPIRNQKMLDSEPVTHVFAFPGGRGTGDMISRAKSRNIPVIIIPDAPQVPS